MKIEITNPQNVINEAEVLTESSIDLDSAAESIEYAVEELKQFWELTQDDATWFYNKLKGNASEMKLVVGCNKDFARIITNYAEKQQKTSQNTTL